MSQVNKIKLSEEVQYAPDAVVSKTLLDKKTGSVTLFAFAAGQKLSEHTAPFDALVQVIDGQGLFYIDGKEYSVDAGEIIVMPADIPHAVKATDNFKMLLTMVRS